jgi:hypothetical protein
MVLLQEVSLLARFSHSQAPETLTPGHKAHICRLLPQEQLATMAEQLATMVEQLAITAEQLAIMELQAAQLHSRVVLRPSNIITSTSLHSSKVRQRVSSMVNLDNIPIHRIN